jgi:glutathione-regulated potassium-efflux system ancillary protein KefG
VESILILFAHPRFEKSRANRALLAEANRCEGVTLHDLYEIYPSFEIDVEREKALLAAHRIIVWQHPFYMYGPPALLKQWLDLVLEVGWAHGAGADALRGKIAFNALTTGGTRESYRPGGYNRFTLREFLRPFEQTALLCNMAYLPPFALQASHRLDDAALAGQASRYRTLLQRLGAGGADLAACSAFPLLNDWLDLPPGGAGP